MATMVSLPPPNPIPSLVPVTDNLDLEEETPAVAKVSPSMKFCLYGGLWPSKAQCKQAIEAWENLSYYSDRPELQEKIRQLRSEKWWREPVATPPDFIRPPPLTKKSMTQGWRRRGDFADVHGVLSLDDENYFKAITWVETCSGGQFVPLTPSQADGVLYGVGPIQHYRITGVSTPKKLYFFSPQDFLNYLQHFHL